MTAIVALILQFLPYLVTAAADIPQLITFLAGLRDIFSRTNVWTADQAAQFDAATEAMRNDPAWTVTD